MILDSQYTDAGRSPAERFVAEEYILDLLNSWEGHRWVSVCVVGFGGLQGRQQQWDVGMLGGSDLRKYLLLSVQPNP